MIVIEIILVREEIIILRNLLYIGPEFQEGVITEAILTDSEKEAEKETLMTEL